MRHAHKITVTIGTSGAAFDDCEHGAIAAILRSVARGIGDGRHALELPGGQVCKDNKAAGTGRKLLDANGNTCGLLIIERLHRDGLQSS